MAKQRADRQQALEQVKVEKEELQDVHVSQITRFAVEKFREMGITPALARGTHCHFSFVLPRVSHGGCPNGLYTHEGQTFLLYSPFHGAFPLLLALLLAVSMDKHHQSTFQLPIPRLHVRPAGASRGVDATGAVCYNWTGSRTTFHSHHKAAFFLLLLDTQLTSTNKSGSHKCLIYTSCGTQ